MLLREPFLCTGLGDHAGSSLQNGKVGSLATVKLNLRNQLHMISEIMPVNDFDMFE